MKLLTEAYEKYLNYLQNPYLVIFAVVSSIILALLGPEPGLMIFPFFFAMNIGYYFGSLIETVVERKYGKDDPFG